MGENKKFKVPHSFVILFSVTLLLCLMTFIIPAGTYDTYIDESTGRSLVNPSSFHYVESSPVGLFQAFRAIPVGLQEGASIVVMVLLIGGAFSVLVSTGAVEAVVGRMAIKMQKKNKLVLILLMVIFFMFGVIGMSDETMVFIPLVIMMCRSFGYDALAATSLVWLSGAVGFNCGAMNPFSVGVAQSIAGLPLYSGMPLRWIMGVALLTVTIIYILRYCDKVKKNPESSLVRDLELKADNLVVDVNLIPELTVRRIIIVSIFVISLIIMAVGLVAWGWSTDDVCAEFLILAVVAGLIAQMGPSKICEVLIEGAKGFLFSALIIGSARAALVVMTEGNIIHTIIYALATVLDSFPRAVTAVGMFFMQSIINFFIPSGSGQAAATMPIMIPLSDILGIERQVAVLAFQMGDGFTNSIIPTAGALMASLAMGNVTYDKYVRFVWKLIIIWFVIGIGFLLVANAIGYA